MSNKLHLEYDCAHVYENGERVMVLTWSFGVELRYNKDRKVIKTFRYLDVTNRVYNATISDLHKQIELCQTAVDQFEKFAV